MTQDYERTNPNEPVNFTVEPMDGPQDTGFQPVAPSLSPGPEGVGGENGCGGPDGPVSGGTGGEPGGGTAGRPGKGGRGPGWLRTGCIALACLAVGAAGASGILLLGGDDQDPAAAQQGQTADTEAMAGQEAPAVTGDTLSGTDIYDLACRQVVGITATGGTSAYGQPETATGSGFILTADGYIVTNYHVVSTALDGGELEVTTGEGETYTAQYVGGDQESDVAVLRIEADGLTPATLGDSSRLAVGESIYVIGNPMGVLDYTLTGGLVSALDREIEVSSDGVNTYAINMFQIDAAVNSGNSGGPVYNARGEVVGMVTAKSGVTGAEGLGFAIPIDDVAALLEDLQTYGYVRGRAYMGITPEDISAAVTEAYGLPSGILVAEVTPDSPAEDAGLQVGDILTALDGQAVEDYAALKALLKGYSADDTAQLSIYRAGQQLELTITFGEKPATETDQETGEAEWTEILPGEEYDIPYGDDDVWEEIWPFS